MTRSKLYKLYDSQYEQSGWKGPKWYQYLAPLVRNREEVVASLVPSSTQSLLDIGCGEGDLLHLCETKVHKLTGTDLLLSRLQRAGKKYPKQVRTRKFSFQQHDSNERFPFSSASFEVITMCSVLEYLLDPYAVLKEIHRLVKPGGTFIIEVPNIAFAIERIRLLFGQLVGVAHAPGWQGGRLHNFTYATLQTLLEEHGFTVQEKTCSGLLPSLRKLWLPLLASDIILTCKRDTQSSS